MGVDGKLENPMLKKKTGLSSKLLNPYQNLKGGLQSFQSTQTVPSHASKNAPSLQPTLTQHASLLRPTNLSTKPQNVSLKTYLVSNKSPSLFNKDLGAGDGLLKRSGFNKKTLKENKSVQHKDLSDTKSTLQNAKLSQSGILNSNKLDVFGEKIHAKSHSSIGKEKVKKSKKKGKSGLYEKADMAVSITEPTYEISLASALKNEKYVDGMEFLKVEVDHFVEKKDDSIIMKKEKEKVDSKKVS